MANDLLIKGGRVIDPSTHTDQELDVLILDGKVSKIAESLAPENGIAVLDATGKIVMPGLIDMHAPSGAWI